jgi:hypothetical protein
MEPPPGATGDSISTTSSSSSLLEDLCENERLQHSHHFGAARHYALFGGALLGVVSVMALNKLDGETIFPCVHCTLASTPCTLNEYYYC